MGRLSKWCAHMLQFVDPQRFFVLSRKSFRFNLAMARQLRTHLLLGKMLRKSTAKRFITKNCIIILDRIGVKLHTLSHHFPPDQKADLNSNCSVQTKRISQRMKRSSRGSTWAQPEHIGHKQRCMISCSRLLNVAYAADIGERRVKFLLLAASAANKEKEP